jgi:DNA invertase Pin-like site-specific DNA recombinase
MPESDLRVAEYLRMSSEHQQYSIENQHDVIAAYAETKQFSIVKTYTDGAKTGVVIKGREGLKQLLKDVMGDAPGYEAILVYDVTRWGRLQDPDEAAHCEFLCKQEGIRVHYCAEPFLNDGDPWMA